METNEQSGIDKELKRMLMSLASICGRQINEGVLRFYIDELRSFPLKTLSEAFSHFSRNNKWPSVAEILHQIGIHDGASANVEPEGEGWSVDITQVTGGWMFDIFQRGPNYDNKEVFDAYLNDKIQELRNNDFTIHCVAPSIIEEKIPVHGKKDASVTRRRWMARISCYKPEK